MILHWTKTILTFLIIFILFSLLIWISIHLYQGYKDYNIPLESKNEIVKLNIDAYQPQTGDIVYFLNHKQPVWLMKNVCSSAFTHIGVVFTSNIDYLSIKNKNDINHLNTLKSNQFEYILESDPYAKRVINPLIDRIKWYQKNRGEIYIRRLITPLSENEYINFSTLVNELCKKNKIDHGFIEDMHTENGFFKTTLPLYYIYISRYALNRTNPIDFEKTNILCTDFTAYTLNHTFNNSNVEKNNNNFIYSCTKPKFFENYSDLNSVFKDKYETILYHIL